MAVILCWLVAATWQAGAKVSAGSQDLPGLANMEILRTVPLVRGSGSVLDSSLGRVSDFVHGQSPARKLDSIHDLPLIRETGSVHDSSVIREIGFVHDPSLISRPVQPRSPRHYEVMLDYDYTKNADNVESDDEKTYEGKVATTLERPQTLLSTDVTDYMALSQDNIESPDVDVAEVSREAFSEPLSSENLLSSSPSSLHKFPLYTAERVPLDTTEPVPLGTTEGTPTQSSKRSNLYLRAVPVSLMSKTGVGGFSGDPQKLPNVNTFIDGYISTPSYLRYIYTSENYLKRNIPSEIYPVIYPSSVDSIYYGGGKVSEGHSQAMDAEKTHNKSYFSDYYHIPQHQHLTNSRYSGGELPIRYYVTSQPVDKKKESRYVRPTHHKAIHSGLTFSSASLSRPSPSKSWDSPFQVPSSITQSSHTAPISSVNENNFHNTPAQRTLFGELDTMNRDEIMYYTGLQKEIEKSDVLLDAIKNVRTREGKMMKVFRNSELTTTTVTPVPDIKAVRNKFGSHPLYDKLPRESTRIIHKEEYEDEKDEYENMYLPVRFKSLELKEIHEVKKNFSSLVPKDAYKSRPLVMHPTHQPPITTYKPPFVPKYNKNRKPMTSPPSKFQFMSTLPSHGKNYSKVKTVNSFHRTSGRVWPSHTNSHRQPAAVYLLGNYNIQKPESLRAYGPSSSQKQRPLKLNNLSSQRLRSHNTHSSGYQSQPLPKHPNRRFPISQRTADHTNPSSRKRGHSRHPTSSLFEDAKILLRPELEKKEKEEMTQKRRPDMEASLFDADVTFPKFGFNIDSYFNRFPKFGFFDYEP